MLDVEGCFTLNGRSAYDHHSQRLLPADGHPPVQRFLIYELKDLPEKLITEMRTICFTSLDNG